jgi:hypothetical protein
MDEMDDSQLKAEIESIMERVNRIMGNVDGLTAGPEQQAVQTEE